MHEWTIDVDGVIHGVYRYTRGPTPRVTLECAMTLDGVSIAEDIIDRAPLRGVKAVTCFRCLLIAEQHQHVPTLGA